MGTVRAAFLITVEVDDDEYAGFVSPATTDWSHERVQSWLSQNYLDRIEDALELQDRPRTMAWTVDTLPDVDAALDFQVSQWQIADSVVGDDDFRDFLREKALRELQAIGQEQDAREQQIYNYENDHTVTVRGYRDFL
jgi:hypothetical protein